MTLNYPKLRKDLIFSRQQAAGETCFIVKNPVRGTYFRFREAERFIIEQFDGATSLETIRQRAEVEFGAMLPMEALRGFVLNLSNTGILETGKQGESPSRSRGKRRV